MHSSSVLTGKGLLRPLCPGLPAATVLVPVVRARSPEAGSECHPQIAADSPDSFALTLRHEHVLGAWEAEGGKVRPVRCGPQLCRGRDACWWAPLLVSTLLQRPWS